MKGPGRHLNEPHCFPFVDGGHLARKTISSANFDGRAAIFDQYSFRGFDHRRDGVALFQAERLHPMIGDSGHHRVITNLERDQAHGLSGLNVGNTAFNLILRTDH